MTTGCGNWGTPTTLHDFPDPVPSRGPSSSVYGTYTVSLEPDLVLVGLPPSRRGRGRTVVTRTGVDERNGVEVELPTRPGPEDIRVEVWYGVYRPRRTGDGYP